MNVNIISLSSIFTIIIIVLFNIVKEQKQVQLFLCVLILLIIFYIVFNNKINYNKKFNKYPESVPLSYNNKSSFFNSNN